MTVFQNGRIILHPHDQFIRVPISPYSHQHLLSSVFLITTILEGIEYYLIKVLTCVSLVANDVE